MMEQNTTGERTIYLTPREVVDRYSGAVKVGTLSVWRHRGIGPAYLKLGKVVVYPLDALLEWEAAQMRAPLRRTE